MAGFVRLYQKLWQWTIQAPPYTYTALDHEGEIRLVKLMPGSYAAGIEVCLENHVLGSADIPNYEALSYTWGDTSVVHPISCEGNLLCVANNLWAALRRLRYEDKPRVLWIDRICINQNDVHERGQQVSIMGSIFGSASLVLVWLGEDDASDVETAINFMRLLRDTYRELDYNTGRVKVDLQRWTEQVKQYPEYESGQHAVVRSLATTWSERVWVFQEALVAKDLLFVRGALSVACDLVELAILFLRRHDVSKPRAFDEAWRRFDSIMLARMDYNKRSEFEKYTAYSMSMLSLLQCTMGMKATDPRDKIYALLHLTSDQDSLNIRPRYDQNFEACYMAVTREVLKIDGNLLCLSLIFPTKAHENGLPTWVPDFRRMSTSWYANFRVNPDIRGSPHCGLYAATGKSDVCIEDTADHTHLALRGVYVGIVCVTSTASGSNANLPSTIGRDVLDRGAWFRFAREQINRDIYPSTGESMEAAFAAIVCGDITLANGHPERLHGSEHDREQFIALFDKESPEQEHHPITLDNYDYAYPVSHATHGKRLICLDTGYLGLTFDRCNLGHKVFLLMGANMPCIVRGTVGNHYKYLCEAYVHGVMDGEGLVSARHRADPTWEAQDASWLQELGDPPYPFDTEQVILI